MKKIISLLFAIICLTACINPNTKNVRKSIEEQMNEEKKTQVENKRHKDTNWVVKLTGELIDARTITEKYNNIPPKYNIVNTVLYLYDVTGGHIKTSKGSLYVPSLKIQKTIKHGSNEIVFNVKTNLITFSDIQLKKTNPMEIRISKDDVINLGNNIEVTYKENEELKKVGLSNFQDIICELTLPIDIINKLRKAQDNITFLLNTNDDVFNITLPKIFIEYLNEM